MVKGLTGLAILASTTLLMLLPYAICTESNISVDSETFPRMTLEIDTDDTVTITVEELLQPKNSTIQRFVVLPFTIDEKISHFPAEALCSWENYQNQYSIFSLLLPPGASKLEIRALSSMLVIANADWRRLVIDFRYETTPVIVAHLINSDQNIWQFEVIRIVFPVGVDTSEVLEIPPPSRSTDSTHDYMLEDILSIGNGRVSIKYSTKGAFWQYEMIFSLIFGVPTAIGIFLTSKEKIKPAESKFRHYLFLVIVAIVWIATGVFTILLFSYGPTWDEISKYYPALTLNSLAMINWVRHALNPLVFLSTKTTPTKD